MKTYSIIISLISILLVITACQDNEVPDTLQNNKPAETIPIDDSISSKTQPGAPATTYPVKPGMDTSTDLEADRKEPFTLAIAGSAVVDGEIYVTLESVHDSRCPVGVECFHAGWAEIVVAVTIADEVNEIITLYHAANRDDKPSLVKIGRLTISVINVVPYPVEGGGPTEDVRVTLMLK